MGRYLNHADGRECLTRSGSRKEQKSATKSKGASGNITQDTAKTTMLRRDPGPVKASVHGKRSWQGSPKNELLQN